MKKSFLLFLMLLLTGCTTLPSAVPESKEEMTKPLAYTLPAETEEESETPTFSSSIPLSDIEYRQFVNQEIQKTLNSIITRLTSIQGIKRGRMEIKIYGDLIATMEQYEVAPESGDPENLPPIANELQNYFNLLTNQFQLDFIHSI